MSEEAKKRLFDALDACRAIRDFTAGRDLAAYIADPMVRAAVERKFEILGAVLRLQKVR